jgi:fructosamine-3-kinase
MSRTGVEDKPPWRLVPLAVRRQVEAAIGSPVRRAVRVWGGYAPTPTFRLALVDGRRAFFKAINQSSNEFATAALRYEERVYGEVAPLLGEWMPQLLATFRCADWHVLLLEDLGPKSVPPWTPGKTRAVTHALARFHQASMGCSPPTWLSRPQQRLAQEEWARTAGESDELRQIAQLAGDASAEALEWFQRLSPTVEQWMQHPALATGPYAILHGDLRSDNLRFSQGRLSLFDWPAITVGRPEWDMVAFAQSVTVEGGPAPEQVMAWYGEHFPLDAAALDCAITWWLTFFADRAWRPEIPGLPRVRRFQRQQLGMMVLWAARQWGMAEPLWAERLLK